MQQDKFYILQESIWVHTTDGSVVRFKKGQLISLRKRNYKGEWYLHSGTHKAFLGERGRKRLMKRARKAPNGELTLAIFGD